MLGKMIIHPDELSRKWIDKLVQAGIGCIGIHPVGGKRAAQAVEALVAQMPEPAYRELIDYAIEQGLTVEYVLHAAGYLMPKSLFASHPDYFRMNTAGERTSDWNFCVSNTESLQLFARRAAFLASELYGSAPIFHFWMDDGRDLHCHCPKCKKLSPSDQHLIAVHAMLTALRERLPDAKMAYLAYYDTMACPVTEKPMPGVFLEYAPMEKYKAGGDADAERSMLVPLLQFFGREHAEVLEYWYDNSLFSRWKKPPAKFVLQAEKMRADIVQYRADGFDRISTFACYLGSDYEALYGEVDITPFGECLR